MSQIWKRSLRLLPCSVWCKMVLREQMQVEHQEIIQLLLLKEEEDRNGHSYLQNDGLSLAGESLIVPNLIRAIHLPREGSEAAQSSQAFRHGMTWLFLFVHKRRGAGDGETRAGLSSSQRYWMNLYRGVICAEERVDTRQPLMRCRSAVDSGKFPSSLCSLF